MAIVFDHTDYDMIFDNMTVEKYIVNDINSMDIEEKTFLDNLLIRKYEDSSLSLVPSCTCGELKGLCYLGNTCSDCGTVVKPTIDEKLTYLLWVRQPKGVAKLINLSILHILLDRYKMTSPSLSLVKYIMVSNLRPNGKNMDNLATLQKLDFILASRGIRRGYNSFVENFVEIIEILENEFAPTSTSKRDKKDFIDFVRISHEAFFCSYMPTPNRSLFILDGNETGTYMDRETLDIVNGINRVAGIDIGDNSQSSKQNAIANYLCDFVKYYKDSFKETQFSKIGNLRKHVMRTRSHFTLRAVVTSLSGIHKSTDVEMPWTAGCSLFREHILNGLSKRGYSYKRAMKHFRNHLERYSPIIDEIFQEIIRDSGGYPCLLNRNPSLHRGSLIFVRIRKFKIDPDDNSLGVSYLLSPLFNMDFDGDMLHLTLLFTKIQIEEAENFAVYNNLLDLSGPNDFSSALKYPKSTTNVLSNWLEDE